MAARTTHPVARAWPTDTCLWGPRPLLLVGKQAAGTRVASSPDSDLEAFSHNPAHGSIAPLAFQPSAMTNYVPPQPNSPPDNVFRPDRPAEAGLGSKKRGIAPLPIHGIIGCSTPGEGPRRSRSQSVPRPARGRPALAAEAARAVRRQPTGSGQGPPCPALRANPFPEVTDPFCPTSLAYIVPSTRGCSPWRPDAVMSTTGRGRHSVLRIFKGRRGGGTGHPRDVRCSSSRWTLPPTESFPGWAGCLNRKDNSSPRPPPTSPDSPNVAIRTDGRSAQAHAQGFAATAAPSYSSGPGTCPDGRVSAQFGTVTRLPVHPASPVLLTKNGPLGALDSVARLNEAAAPSYLFKNSHPGSSYPEGNFGGNQLLDGSISLSPLYPSQTNDLHVSIAAGLHQSFLWLRPAQA
ncbi:hypothetical protein L1887_47851 [Cichorium endivia]|nr:hypothetical protein L1887_47851 [Cichorium endivia]